MSLGLSAPAAVPVELRVAERRFFRLSEEIGTGGIRLSQAAPFEPGRPVTAKFCLPGSREPLEIEAEITTTGHPSEDGEGGGAAVIFLRPGPDIQSALGAYVADRLGIPLLP